MASQKKEEFVILPVLYESWPKLKGDLKALAAKDIAGISSFEEILEKNDRWENVGVPCELLRKVLREEKFFSTEHFSDTLLPWLAQKALDAEHLFQYSEHKIKNLYCGREDEVVLSRRQICSLLALALFNSFEPQPGCYQQFTLSAFLTFAMSRSQASKLLCLLHYFDRLRQSEEKSEHNFLERCVSVRRKKLSMGDSKSLSWKRCDDELVPFESLPEGMIEDCHGCLQVDFANAYIGGGVLNFGTVQEEIRFVISPECLVSMLFCEEMDSLESILITGAEQFSTYSGYGGTFTCTGPHTDTNPIDARNRCCVSIVAIDAEPYYGGSNFQFDKRDILRELNKAYSGFTFEIPGDDPAGNGLASVATGNWGCGAFGGDKHLKTLIQWMAASRAKRNVKYYTFNDKDLSEKQVKMVEELRRKKMTVSQLYQILISDSNKRDVFESLS